MDREGGRGLGAVHQRQAFLCFEYEGLEACCTQGIGSRLDAARMDYVAGTDERRRHMGERSKIAGSADRSLARHERRDVMVEQSEKCVRKLRARAGITA